MTTFLESICKAEGIHLDPAPWINGVSGINGAAMSVDGNRIIAYKSTLTGWEKVSVLAHELGHHILGHLGEHAPPVKQADLEAQCFAAAFTAVALFMKHVQHLG